jgi:hypothetical protein
MAVLDEVWFGVAPKRTFLPVHREAAAEPQRSRLHKSVSYGRVLAWVAVAESALAAECHSAEHKDSLRYSGLDQRRNLTDMWCKSLLGCPSRPQCGSRTARREAAQVLCEAVGARELCRELPRSTNDSDYSA